MKGGNACDRQFFALARKKTTCTRGPAGLAIQGEKIVVSADRFCNDANPILHIVVMRLNANGTRDRTFGKKGEVTVSGTAPLVVSAPLIVLPNDHLVVAGTTPKGEKVQLTELLSNGAIDRSFGEKGVVSTKAAGGTPGNLTGLMSDHQGILSLTGNNYTGESGGPLSAQFRALFLDTVLRPVGGWGVERWVPPLSEPARSRAFLGSGLVPRLGLIAPDQAGVTNGLPGRLRPGERPPSQAFTVAPTSAGSPSWMRPAAFVPST